jgi:hypothetical protein
MAASKWQIYNEAKKYLLKADLDLDSTAVRVKLLSGAKAATVSDYTRSTFASLTHITTNLKTAIKSLPGLIVTAGASAKAIKFDSTAFIFSASGGTVTSIQYAVIGISNGKCLAWCKLSSAVFSLSAGNTLTITPNASGIFTLTGGVTA